MIFLSSDELASQIKQVLNGFVMTNMVGGTQLLRDFRRDLAFFVRPENSWEAQWDRTMNQGVFGVVKTN